MQEQLNKYLMYKDGMFDLNDLMKQIYLLHNIFLSLNLKVTSAKNDKF